MSLFGLYFYIHRIDYIVLVLVEEAPLDEGFGQLVILGPQDQLIAMRDTDAWPGHVSPLAFEPHYALVP
jgi:hypothetical protein